MPEVEPCALCGRELVTLGKDSYPRYGYSCCGITIWSKDTTKWNRVQAALRAEKELAELKAAVKPVVTRYIEEIDWAHEYMWAYNKKLDVQVREIERLCGGGECQG